MEMITDYRGIYCSIGAARYHDKQVHMGNRSGLFSSRQWTPQHNIQHNNLSIKCQELGTSFPHNNMSDHDLVVDLIPNGNEEFEQLKSRYGASVESLAAQSEAFAEEVKSYRRTYERTLDRSLASTDRRLRRMIESALQAVWRLREPRRLFDARTVDPPPTPDEDARQYVLSPEERAYYDQRASLIRTFTANVESFNAFIRDGDALKKNMDRHTIASAGRQFAGPRMKQQDIESCLRAVKRAFDQEDDGLRSPAIALNVAGDHPPPDA